MSARSELASLSRKRLERLEANLTSSLETGDVEAIHQVRVSSRRLVEFIRIFGACLDERPIRRTGKSLRRMRNLFCDIRDLDVLQASLTKAGAETNFSPTDLAQLEGWLTTRRERALNRVRSKCKARKIEKTAASIANLIDDFEEAAGGDERILEDARARWRDRADDLIRETDPANQRVSLHPMRICLKRFRYSTELLLRLEGRENEEVLEHLAGLQDELGAWNDGAFAAREIARIARDPDTLSAQPRRAAGLFAYAGERCLDMESRQESIMSKLAETHEFLQRVRQSSLTAGAGNPAPLTNTAG